MLNREHGIRDDEFVGDTDMQLECLEVYYKPTSLWKYTPRAILADLDVGGIDTVRGGPLGGCFRPENMVSAYNSTGSNWAKGHVTEVNTHEYHPNASTTPE